MPLIYKKARITYALIIINIIIYFLAARKILDEDLIFFYAPLIAERGEWYRIITAGFMHFGPEHLISNMLSLFIVGAYVELFAGGIWYIVIYMASLIAGNMFTYLVEVYISGNYFISAGASGAIAGLVGAFLIFLIKRYLRAGKFNIPVRNFILCAFCIVLPGLTDNTVNAWAHIGGFLGGIIAGAAAAAVKSVHSGDKSS